MDSGTSWRSAMMMPPMAIIGAKSISVRPMAMQHLHLLDVVGVAGDERRGAEAAHLALGEALDLAVEGAASRRAPVPMAVFAALNTEVIEQTVMSSATPSMMRPVRRM